MWIIYNGEHCSLNDLLLLLTLEEAKEIKGILDTLLLKPDAQYHMIDQVRGREISIGINSFPRDDLDWESVSIEIDQDL